ncbi:hypothetical protein VHEMI05367 [[Torrubiella] hemipterigena]|uniref:Uncharacterized protein n=1 Tax=[Torrubiella] hemipterigena TaxID=1531966 RepID=A0A0A1SXR5_9HYPO|nr:hypothetical protein VHEMI05367 [[Torrubiella] hemipterigena]
MVVSIIVQDEITVSLSIVLRKLSIFVFVVSFVPYIVQGAISKEVFPALGLLGLAGSALLAVIDLRSRRVRLPETTPRRGSFRKYVTLLADLGLLTFHLSFIIVSIIILSQGGCGWRGYRGGSGAVVMGTYNTLALWTNLLIHGYFILRCLASNKEDDEVAAIIEEGRAAHPRFQPYGDAEETSDETTRLVRASREPVAEASIDASKN